MHNIIFSSRKIIKGGGIAKRKKKGSTWKKPWTVSLKNCKCMQNHKLSRSELQLGVQYFRRQWVTLIDAFSCCLFCSSSVYVVLYVVLFVFLNIHGHYNTRESDLHALLRNIQQGSCYRTYKRNRKNWSWCLLQRRSHRTFLIPICKFFSFWTTSISNLA